MKCQTPRVKYIESIKNIEKYIEYIKSANRMRLHRCSDRRKCRGFFSRTVFSTCRRPRLPKVGKRCENCARPRIDGSRETSPINSLKYFHQPGLPKNICKHI